MKKWYKNCPHCWKEIKSVAIKCQYCLKFLNEEPEKKTKECPFCMNEIDINENKCPFCEEILEKSKKKLSINPINLNFLKSKKLLYVLCWIIILWVLFYIFNLVRENINEKEIYNRNLECQKWLSQYKSDLNFLSHENHEYSNVWIFYSPIEKTCIWYFKEYHQSPMYDYYVDYYTFMIEDLSWLKVATYHFNHWKERVCYWWSDFYGGVNYDGEYCDVYGAESARKQEIERLKWNKWYLYY